MARQLKNYLRTTLTLFGLLGLVFIPVNLYPYQQQLSDALFKPVLVPLLQLFPAMQVVNPDLSSDSTLLYLLLCLLFVLALFSAAIFPAYAKLPEGLKAWHKAPESVFVYYLALHLLRYGFNKVFKAQFYLPEPNILYTPFGQLDQDILYWSTMGTSYTYNLFLGSAEVLCALLLLFGRTRAIGLFASAAVLFNIVAINLCFDISVKLLSSFLLFITLLLLYPHLRLLLQLFVYKQPVQAPALAPWPIFEQKPVLKKALKTLVGIGLCAWVLWPYVVTRNFNDDKAPRPYLHGAYKLIPERSSSPTTIKRVFVHRGGFLIFQDAEDHFTDYKYEADEVNGKLRLTDYAGKHTTLDFWYLPKDSILSLVSNTPDWWFDLKLKQLNWEELPALKSQFHVTADGFN